jgi:hypothetical protein
LQKAASMMSPLLRAAPLAALALLAACNSEPTTIGGENSTENTAEAAPVKLPPALQASKTYRCKDNSVVYVDYFNDNLTANFKVNREDVPTPLVAPAAGQPFTGEGITVSGTPTGKSAEITRPGKGAQTCDS